MQTLHSDLKADGNATVSETDLVLPAPERKAKFPGWMLAAFLNVVHKDHLTGKVTVTLNLSEGHLNSFDVFVKTRS